MFHGLAATALAAASLAHATAGTTADVTDLINIKHVGTLAIGEAYQRGDEYTIQALTPGASPVDLATVTATDGPLGRPTLELATDGSQVVALANDATHKRRVLWHGPVTGPLQPLALPWVAGDAGSFENIGLAAGQAVIAEGVFPDAGSLRLVDPATGAQRKLRLGDDTSLPSLTTAGGLAAINVDESAWVIDVAKATTLRKLDTGLALSLALAADGRLAAADFDGGVTFYDVNGKPSFPKLPGHPIDVRFDRAGGYAIAFNVDDVSEIRSYDSAGQQVGRTLPTGLLRDFAQSDGVVYWEGDDCTYGAPATADRAPIVAGSCPRARVTLDSKSNKALGKRRYRAVLRLRCLYSDTSSCLTRVSASGIDKTLTVAAGTTKSLTVTYRPSRAAERAIKATNFRVNAVTRDGQGRTSDDLTFLGPR